MRLSKQQRCVKELQNMSVKQGLITTYQIADKMNEYEVPSEAIDSIVATLSKMTKIVDMEEEEKELWEEINAYQAEQEYNASSELLSAFDQYYRSIRKFPILDREQTNALAKEIKEATDPKVRLEARNQLVQHNLRYVVTVAKKFEYAMPRMDAIQEGNCGLIKAAERFDYTKNFQFLTYATWWISHFIRRAVPKQNPNPIKYPVYFINQMDTVSKARYKLQAELGKENITVDELVKETGLTRKQVLDTITNAREVVSLDYTVNSDDSENSASLENITPDRTAPSVEEEVETLEMSAKVRKWILSTLDEREAKIIFDRLGLVDGKIKTLDQVGEELGLSKERVRQLQGFAINKLRKSAPDFGVNVFYIQD